MKLDKLEIRIRKLPLKKIFRTALRETDSIDEMVVVLSDENGVQGYGAACNCAAITGDVIPGMKYIIEEHIFPMIHGMDMHYPQRVLSRIQLSIAYNPGAKAAMDIAVYDLWARSLGIPLYRLLGGYRDCLHTDITLSLDTPENMAKQALEAKREGFSILKIKVGRAQDVERVRQIRDAVGPEMRLRVDANQAWQPRQAVKIIQILEKYEIDLVEQPVAAWDIDGLKWVRERVNVPIMADESLLSPHDAFRILECGAVDYLNIKLLKCGGIYPALQIIRAAESAGVECMLGCMMEGMVSLAAAIHLAAAEKNITAIDLDPPLFLAQPDKMPYIDYRAPEILLGERRPSET